MSHHSRHGPEPPALALREIKFIEKFDLESIGWTPDVGMGTRYAQRTETLFVSENEPVFDQLLRRASWEHWQTLTGRDNVSPIHWVDWQGDGTADTTRALVNEWQQSLFNRGDPNKGFLILTHVDPNFLRRFQRRRTGRESYQIPAHGQRRA